MARNVRGQGENARGTRRRSANSRGQARRGKAGQVATPSRRGAAQEPSTARSRRAAAASADAAKGDAGFSPADSPSPDPAAAPEFVSESAGEIRARERARRLRASSRRYFLRIFLVLAIAVALVAGWAALYNSPAFSIENVSVNGVEHLTADEMTQLANVPADTTLLRVDADQIADRLRQNSWVQDVQINRAFPDTLEINVTERPIAAVVEIPVSQGSVVKQWLIATDHTWLMPIPDAGSEAAQTTSPKIYEDAETALRILDVPYGTPAEIGQMCSDDNVNNALDIMQGMTTDLAGHVVQIRAAGQAETTLVLDSGVEVAFGKAEDIRDKERVIEEIMNENPDGVAYINVRIVGSPTWRAV